MRLTHRIRNHRALLASVVLLVVSTSCIYMKMNPPPDADKPSLTGNNSCYLATASNMLAGAGYGNGTTVQARADDIYSQMTNHFGISSGGWADTALTWWLGSTNNTWTTNPYTVVTVYGNKTKVPWNNSNGARDIGNDLRSCAMVGLSLSWPPAHSGESAYGGHAITSWGDNAGNVHSLNTNPANVRVTDSDNDTGGDVQNYRYDAFSNPNPGGQNSGNGWYIDYGSNHPFIKHIVTLTAAAGQAGGATTQRVLGSYKILQHAKANATDLHYNVGTDIDILTYRTWLDWTEDVSPAIVEASPRRSLTVDWDLSKQPVPSNNWVTISTEFILPRWNSMTYSNVHFTYPPGTAQAPAPPEIHWGIETPTLREATKIHNVSGGYVVGAFDLLSEAGGEKPVAEYRFVHQYSYDQSPEDHTFSVTGPKGYTAANLRFGHSYGYLDHRALWEFREWMTQVTDKKLELGEKPATFVVDWHGRLPYPEGEIVPWTDPKTRERYLKKK